MPIDWALRGLVGLPVQKGDIVANMLLQEEHDDGSLIKESFFQNPLVHSIKGVLRRITNFKEKARSFYFEVILSQYH